MNDVDRKNEADAESMSCSIMSLPASGALNITPPSDCGHDFTRGLAEFRIVRALRA
jgi:hypothetical protein